MNYQTEKVDFGNAPTPTPELTPTPTPKEDKLSVTTKDLVEFATDTYNVSKLMIYDVEANVDAIKSSD
ncbi:hypothetical protein, partial [Ureaplasma urealyticum]|uniref:hypothetical protein n=1 Tax=Ureaplasma urealyticum TaxID=2130 RepID=UPI000169D75B